MSFPAVPAVNLRRLTLKRFLKLSLLVILYAICFFIMFQFEYKETGWFHSPLHSSSIVRLPQLPVGLSSSALCRAQRKRIWLKRRKVFQIKIWQVLVSSLGFRHISSLPSRFSQKLQGGQYHWQYLKQQGNPS